MAIFTTREQPIARAAAELAYCNPFLPQRVEAEKRVLGRACQSVGRAWSLRVDQPDTRPNVRLLGERIADLAERARNRLAAGHGADDTELEVYDRLVLYTLYDRYVADFQSVLSRVLHAPGRPPRMAFYNAFVADARRFMALPGRTLPALEQLPVVFACLAQIRRAFHHIFSFIVGSSPAATDLRAAVWQSIFTDDLGRYRRVLYHRMGDIPTLVLGPSGSGKELVARAIAMSRFVPFDVNSLSLRADPAASFEAVNLSALSPTLIESELFGHARGSFTGAVSDRAGWLETCSPLGTVFLDEVGELDPAVQVKLLRVLATRSFQRIGQTQTRRFEGKIIAATHRDPAELIRTGRMRSDFYYRLCADVVVTPALHDMLQPAPGDLADLVLFISRRMVGPHEAPALAAQVQRWIDQHIGEDYDWPGNVRELEQCVANMLVRSRYQPLGRGHEPVDGASTRRDSASDPRDELCRAMLEGRLSADALVDRYCTLVYARTGSYQKAGRRLGLDRRTVRARVDRRLLKRLRRGTSRSAPTA